MSSSKTVTLFIQCLVDTIYPEVAQAMVQVFRRLGIALICPTDQTCCGQPAFNSGYRQSARVAAKHFIEVFADAEQIVCPSGVLCEHGAAPLSNACFKTTPAGCSGRKFWPAEFMNLANIWWMSSGWRIWAFGLTARLRTMTRVIYYAVSVFKNSPVSFSPMF